MPDDQRARAVEVLLAEYGSVRAVVDRRAASKLTLVTFNVTAIAGVAGFVITGNTDQRLLLILPLLSSITGLLAYAFDEGIRSGHSYIRRTLRPLIVEYIGDDRLLGWSAHDDASQTRLHVAVTESLPLGLLFAAPSLVTLVVVIPRLRSVGDWAAWIIGGLTFLLLITTWSVRLWRLTKQFLRDIKDRSLSPLDAIHQPTVPD